MISYEFFFDTVSVSVSGGFLSFTQDSACGNWNIIPPLRKLQVYSLPGLGEKHSQSARIYLTKHSLAGPFTPAVSVSARISCFCF